MQCKYSIAVILATYNGEKYLEEQLQSILWQTLPVLKIIIRDDCSNDGTVDILNKYKAKYGSQFDIIYDHVGRIGHAGGNFLKIFQSSSLDGYDYVFLADQDDVWFPSKIERAVKMINEKFVNCYASNLLAYNEGKNKSWTILKDEPQTHLDYFFQGASAGCTYGLNRIAIQIIQKHLSNKVNLSIVFSHDWLIYAVTRSYGCRWFIDNKPPMLYRQHSGNAYGDLGVFKNIYKKLRMIIAGWYKEQILHNLEFLNPDDPQCSYVKAILKGSVTSKVKLLMDLTKLRRKTSDSIFCAVYVLLK
jgi:rhamnosyltransferase